MKLRSEIKHFILLALMISIIGLLAFTLSKSNLNEINLIKITGNKYLEEKEYLKYAQLENIKEKSELRISIIRDRLEKHPYISNVDVVIEERGNVNIEIFEKFLDAVLLSNSKNYLVTNNAEILPLLNSTQNINLPVIVSNNKDDIKLFSNAVKLKSLKCALNIISAAEFYDQNLLKNISEIELLANGDISLSLSSFSSPIYFGNEDEIEKTVFLSRIYKQMNDNKLTEYLKYIDLRYNQLVYLGFNELATSDKEKI